ncbi:MAG: SPOR domain-containing protein [Gammaproteobacteria bacterium]|nr:SPOR domain-containing protein [Gammaproteobacteria bacterium]
MDTALKNRLTGAIILILIAVLLLPEILTGAGQRIKARAPMNSGDGPPVRSYKVDLTEAAPMLTKKPMVESAEIALPMPFIPVLAKTLEVAKDPAPEPKLSPKIAVLQTVIPKGAPVIEPLTSVLAVPVGSFYVQIGSFKSRSAADSLLSGLKKQQFSGTVLPSSGESSFYRVRIGPANDRVAAKGLAVRLASAGHPGSIVPPNEQTSAVIQ